MRAEACDAGPDLVPLVAMELRERRRVWLWCWLNGADRLVRDFEARRCGLGFGLGQRLVGRHGRKSGFRTWGRSLGIRFWRFGDLGGDRLNEGICLRNQRIAFSLPIHRNTPRLHAGFGRIEAESSGQVSSFWGQLPVSVENSTACTV
jgi:hypothetical protein